ncbi:MAG: OmpA family protein, partial [Burkholderiales bacterium]|nr:OmpA family protein [Burkholderiales bacterium]
MSKLLKQLLIVAIVGSAVVACSSTKQPVASEPVASEPVASEAVVAPEPVVSNHNAVYFAFNKYDVKEGYNGIVASNANYLASNSGAKLQVQGNTDDIGSVEYNLALGQKRADAVKKALIASGAHKGQIETVSYGKLKAKYSNDTNASRAMNRRADVVYKVDAPKSYNTDSNGLP